MKKKKLVLDGNPVYIWIKQATKGWYEKEKNKVCSMAS